MNGQSLPPVREIFLATADAALMTMAADEVRAAWEGPSALEAMSVGALVGHLGRAVLTVETYMEGEPPEPERELLSAGDYYARILDQLADRRSVLNAEVLRRAEQSAARGQEVVVEETASSLARLRARLDVEPPERAMEVFGGMAMMLDQYLFTRVVELLVHTDDICVSVGIPMVGMQAPAFLIATGTLLQTATSRHGFLGILRALTRRERDPHDALRVL